jgi:hypothetical protein
VTAVLSMDIGIFLYVHHTPVCTSAWKDPSFPATA